MQTLMAYPERFMYASAVQGQGGARLSRCQSCAYYGSLPRLCGYCSGKVAINAKIKVPCHGIPET